MYRQFPQLSKLRISFWLPAVMAALLAAPIAAQQSEKEGAKTIFYNPSTGAASKPDSKPKSKIGKPSKDKSPQSQDDKILVVKTQNSGLHYWFEMEGVGKVGEDRVFYTGDRIRLHLRSNLDGYLTLWAYDSSGQSKLLFPEPKSGESRALSFSEGSNFVRANIEYTPGMIVFSSPAEDEHLIIFFSISKDDVPSFQKGSLTAQQISQATQTEGGKSLLFEVEKKDQATFGSYVANRQGGGITKEIKLKHRERQ